MSGITGTIFGVLVALAVMLMDGSEDRETGKTRAPIAELEMFVLTCPDGQTYAYQDEHQLEESSVEAQLFCALMMDDSNEIDRLTRLSYQRR